MSRNTATSLLISFSFLAGACGGESPTSATSIAGSVSKAAAQSTPAAPETGRARAHNGEYGDNTSPGGEK